MVVVNFFLGQLLSSYKWWLLTRSGKHRNILAAGRKGRISSAWRSIGLGLAPLEAIGSRSRARKQVKQKTTALASVFADRLHGITVLAAIGVVSIAFVRSPAYRP